MRENIVQVCLHCRSLSACRRSESRRYLYKVTSVLVRKMWSTDKKSGDYEKIQRSEWNRRRKRVLGTSAKTTLFGQSTPTYKLIEVSRSRCFRNNFRGKFGLKRTITSFICRGKSDVEQISLNDSSIRR